MSVVLHSAVGVGHVLAAGVALGAGTCAVLQPKRPRRHRYVGGLYVVSMLGVEWTAFHLYYLFGHFGIVHAGAVGSGLALLVGLGAVAGRTFVRAWRQWHYLGMGASLVGVYTAFVVESTYRLFPPAYFWWSTLGAAGACLLAGGWLLHRHLPRWPAARPARRYRPATG
ncbi:MAG: hypothetical protein EOO59_13795 [Hymenobacter sp.]|nr:MAG: hypothetical protein EOO59_13795 [Hymenobacter sp.]